MRKCQSLPSPFSQKPKPYNMTVTIATTGRAIPICIATGVPVMLNPGYIYTNLSHAFLSTAYPLTVDKVAAVEVVEAVT